MQLELSKQNCARNHFHKNPSLLLISKVEPLFQGKQTKSPYWSFICYLSIINPDRFDHLKTPLNELICRSGSNALQSLWFVASSHLCTNYDPGDISNSTHRMLRRISPVGQISDWMQSGGDFVHFVQTFTTFTLVEFSSCKIRQKFNIPFA